jgi:hypothetical protein
VAVEYKQRLLAVCFLLFVRTHGLRV